MTVELYLGDCLEIIQELEDESVDAVITDPPYGVKRDKGFTGSAPFGGGNGKPIKRRQYSGDWDSNRPGIECFEEMQRVSKIAFIFGGNYFADLLPQGTHWVVWDKLNTMPTFGDCELIWTNLPRKSVKKITCEYNGLLGKREERYHPTQKPETLMRQLILTYTQEGDTILDPFMGSGTTGVACVQTGRNFIGIEIEPKYYEIAEKRIAEAQLQIRMEI